MEGFDELEHVYRCDLDLPYLSLARQTLLLL